MNIEDDLKRALRAEDPGAAFTQRVLAPAREPRTTTRGDTVAAEKASASANPSANAAAAVPRRTLATRWIAAVAASLALGVAGVQWIQYRHYVAEGERARAQVLAALRVTNETLNLVQDKITEPANPRQQDVR